MYCPRCHRDYDATTAHCPADGTRLLERRPVEDLDETPSAPAATVIAGRYRLGAVIGQGSMARVYHAVDLATHESVAVKILSKHYAAKDTERTRFFREAKAILQIQHANVVKVLDVGRWADGRPFIVIDYLKGESLGTRLRRDGRIEPTVALGLLRDAAAGLSAVHAAAIVHRDVKPDNIFLVGEPGAPSGVKLVDFGLAKLHSHHSSESGTALGTAAYMPPEQVLSERVDARADIYALGVVLFRTLTGHLPFEGERNIDLLAHQVLLAAPPPSWFVESLDPRIDELVRRAMRKRPENRYQTMAAMLADMRAILRDPDAQLSKPPEQVEPDVYEPTTSLGRDAALLFCKKLGVDPPEWQDA